MGKSMGQVVTEALGVLMGGDRPVKEQEEAKPAQVKPVAGRVEVTKGKTFMGAYTK